MKVKLLLVTRSSVHRREKKKANVPHQLAISLLLALSYLSLQQHRNKSEKKISVSHLT